MRIAINTLALGKIKAGMGNYITKLVNLVPKADKENTYIIFTTKQNQQYFKKRENVEFVTFKKTNSVVRIFQEQLLIPYILKKKEVDIYHNPGFSLPFMTKKKCIVTIADMTFFSHPEYHRESRVAYFKFMIPKAIKKAKAVITISHHSKEQIEKYTNGETNKGRKEIAEKLHVTYLAASSHFTKKEAKEVQKIREKYGIKKQYLLSVGTLEPRKNIAGLLDAYATLPQDIRKTHELVIVGAKGWKYDAIFDKIGAKEGIKENIHTLGFVPDEDLAALYSGATVFVYPSFYEGFGLPVVEAMQCECPVITAENSSLKEIGEAAVLYCDPKDTKDIAEKIASLIKNKAKRDEYKEKGKNRAKEFNWEHMAKETKKIYEMVDKSEQ